MKTTTNTTSTKQLIAVFAADEFYIDERGYTPRGHAFVNGIRFDDVTPDDILDLVHSFEPNATMTETAHFVTDDGYAPATTVIFTVDQLVTVSPIAETVTLETVKRDTVPSHIAVNPHDAKQLHRIDPETLATRYGVNRIKQRAMFTVGNDKDAQREYIYRAIDSGAPYVLYHGELLAIPESAILPNNGAVTVSHVEPAPKTEAPKNDAPKRKHEYVVFRYGNNVYSRKIHANGTVNHDRQVWNLKDLDCVSKHYTKQAADKRVKQERKNAKRADKLTTKTEAPKNGNGCKHIPETYKGLVVDVQNGNMADIDRKAAWSDVAALVDELVAAGIALDCITYERSYAWVIPTDRSDKFARANHTVVSMTTKRGHSLKDRRRAWFVKCTK